MEPDPCVADGENFDLPVEWAAGRARLHVEAQTADRAWEATDMEGFERIALAVQPEFKGSTFLERWSPNFSFGERSLEGGAEIFVLKGRFDDEFGEYGEGSWLRLPAGTRHRPTSATGCMLYVKYDGLGELRHEPSPT